ncbi:YlmH family RNA-binding protein [Bacillus testis]|uniref:YlmH family RNA-binding protein n=1 Tax=Bacillus testis TaxID=1622072 RepID=UPI00067ECC9D|nr:RNA-binding protein [Bacillus testis]
MSIYQHFRSEEKVFIDNVLEWKESVETFYSPKLTPFLDPREQHIVSVVIGQNEDCKLAFFGGYDGAERKRALLYPNYYEPSEEDFQCSAIAISYNRKFHELTHPQILGTLMSLGIIRERFGDVLIEEESAKAIVDSDIASYVINNITKIGQAGVSLELASLSDLTAVHTKWQESHMTSSSLRIDSLLSSMTRLSRQKAQDLIQGGKVKVNHLVIEEKDYVCHKGDVISCRGYGRFLIVEIEGKTKKDKWKIVFGQQK